MGFKRPGGGEREGWLLTLQPPADIPFYREENRQECHSGLAPPSIIFPSAVPARLQERWEGLAVSPDVSLESEGMTHQGHF